MERWEFLCQVVRTIPDDMGGTITRNNNLYATNFNILRRTDDGMYPVYEWWAAEVDPRTADIDPSTGEPILYSGLKKLYNHNSLATIDEEVEGSEVGVVAGEPVGIVSKTINLFGGVISKVSLIVETTPGDEIEYTPE